MSGDNWGEAFCDALETAKAGTTGHLLDPNGVNHPAHYNNHPSGVECIEIKRYLPSNVADAVKYLWRSDLKELTSLKDLKKAFWYLDDQLAHEHEMIALYQPCCVPVEVLERLDKVVNVELEAGNQHQSAFYQGVRDYFSRYRVTGLQDMRTAVLHLIAEHD